MPVALKSGLSATTVSLVITTKLLKVSEITGIIGIEPSPGTHDCGSKRKTLKNSGGADVWKYTTWRLDSALEDNTAMIAHLESLLSHVTAETLKVLPEDVDINCDVVVMYDTATVSKQVSKEVVRRLADHNMGITISCYPVA